MKNKKGSVTLMIVFFIAAVIIITITAVLAPMGVLFNTAMFTAGEDILNQSQPYIDDIKDTDIRNTINDVVTSAKAAGSDNIEVNANLFQYSWVFIIILTGLIIFLLTRRAVEYGGLI